MTGWQRQIPNGITVARLALTALFFTLLNVHQAATFRTTMWVAFVVFVIAALTDILDGYLARSWKVESAFGRVVDPFVDKILICGAFIFFASTDFIDKSEFINFGLGTDLTTITGVTPWMAVVLIAREFLITGIRGLAERKGIDFRADWAGKVKMFVQSVAIGAIIVDVATAYDRGPLHGPIGWVRLTRDILIWLTLIITVLSATGYILRARRILED
ncbi:MAG: CDP-alcohol phosphatidyltransferase family protein [Phycisphaerae bacterium]